MDSVRAQNTSLHEYERDTTPFLGDFAKESHHYTQARSPSRWSVPSHASIFTGQHVWEHGVTEIGHRLPTETTIWHDLSEQDYDTGVFSRNSFLTLDNTGLSDGFNTVEGLQTPPFPAGLNPQAYANQREFLADSLTHAPVRSILNGAIIKFSWDYPDIVPQRVREMCPRLKPDRPYVDAFLDWIDGREQWAACVNLMDAHGPLNPSTDKWESEGIREIEEEAETPWDFYEGRRTWETLSAFEDLYDEAIFDVDQHVKRIIKTLAARDVLDDTLVVITADHGEGFGEPDPLRPGARICGHIAGTHEHLFHVPLLVRPPGGEKREVSTPVTITEFPDVVRRALGGEAPVFGEMPVWAFDAGEMPGRTQPEYVDPDDYDRFLGTAKIRYTQDGERVKKVGELDGTRMTAMVEGTSVVNRTYDEGELSVPFDEKDQLVIDCGSPDANAEVRSHLEHLGYV